jgi:lipoate-protein ligase A
MAVDEALLDSYASADPPGSPTLRLYSWLPATLSLGARQEAGGSHDPEFLREEGIGLVRRPTGGRAVLHEHERTFAIVGTLRREPFPGGVLDTYRRIAAALLEAFRRLGLDPSAAATREPTGPPAPPVCFDRASAHEITISGRKIVGSAQMRRRGAFLQHGSILLRADADRLSRAVGVRADAGRFTDLERAAGRPLLAVDVDRAVIAGFAAALGVELCPAVLTEREAARATQLRCWKYDSASWTLGGRLGDRERRWGPACLL